MKSALYSSENVRESSEFFFSLLLFVIIWRRTIIPTAVITLPIIIATVCVFCVCDVPMIQTQRKTRFFFTFHSYSFNDHRIFFSLSLSLPTTKDLSVGYTSDSQMCFFIIIIIIIFFLCVHCSGNALLLFLFWYCDDSELMRSFDLCSRIVFTYSYFSFILWMTVLFTLWLSCLSHSARLSLSLIAFQRKNWNEPRNGDNVKLTMKWEN